MFVEAINETLGGKAVVELTEIDEDAFAKARTLCPGAEEVWTKCVFFMDLRVSLLTRSNNFFLAYPVLISMSTSPVFGTCLTGILTCAYSWVLSSGWKDA